MSFFVKKKDGRKEAYHVDKIKKDEKTLYGIYGLF